MNKRGMTPIVATLILVIFSLLLGMATMHVGKSYIDDIGTTVEANEEITFIDGIPYTCTAYEGKECTNWERQDYS